jgi:hypothetical protein
MKCEQPRAALPPETFAEVSTWYKRKKLLAKAIKEIS